MGNAKIHLVTFALGPFGLRLSWDQPRHHRPPQPTSLTPITPIGPTTIDAGTRVTGIEPYNEREVKIILGIIVYYKLQSVEKKSTDLTISTQRSKAIARTLASMTGIHLKDIPLLPGEFGPNLKEVQVILQAADLTKSIARGTLAHAFLYLRFGGVGLGIISAILRCAAKYSRTVADVVKACAVTDPMVLALSTALPEIVRVNNFLDKFSKEVIKMGKTMSLLIPAAFISHNLTADRDAVNVINSVTSGTILTGANIKQYHLDAALAKLVTKATAETGLELNELVCVKKTQEKPPSSQRSKGKGSISIPEINIDPK